MSSETKMQFADTTPTENPTETPFAKKVIYSVTRATGWAPEVTMAALNLLAGEMPEMSLEIEEAKLNLGLAHHLNVGEKGNLEENGNGNLPPKARFSGIAVWSIRDGETYEGPSEVSSWPTQDIRRASLVFSTWLESLHNELGRRESARRPIAPYVPPRPSLKTRKKAEKLSPEERAKQALRDAGIEF